MKPNEKRFVKSADTAVSVQESMESSARCWKRSDGLVEHTRARRKEVFGKEKSVGYGYVGVWSDGTLGWWLPNHLGYGKSPHPPSDGFNTYGDPIKDRAYLCRITVEKIRNPRGHKPITRKPKKKAV